MAKSKKIIAIISIIIVLGCILSAVYLLIIHPTDVYVIKQGSLSEEDETAGYVIRDEIVIKGENYENGIYAIVSEGKRVAVQDSIFRYYSDNEKETRDKINELNSQIQKMLAQEKNTPSADIKVIENQIEEKIKNINRLTNYQEITENKKDIDNLISKKINYLADATKNKETKQLIKERNQYEEQLKKGSEEQKTKIAGIVSYRVDGLEEKLTPNNFDEITEKYLNSLDLKTGNIVSASNECGKVINNFKCYIAITMNSKNAMKAQVGDTPTLRDANNVEYKSKIVQINEESGKRTIIFQINVMTENLINHRKIALDVIWWDESGLKVPKQALTEENGLYYVTINKTTTQTKTLVKVKRQTDKFAIIEAYENKELQELGYSATEIKNYKKIANYDEIVIEQ